jgi:hypothetical protein
VQYGAPGEAITPTDRESVHRRRDARFWVSP